MMRTSVRVTVFLVGALVLAGCSQNPENQSFNSAETLAPQNQSEASPGEYQNEWVTACANYVPLGETSYHEAYNKVISEFCAIADPETYEVPHILSPLVSLSDAHRYLNAEAFHESFWATRMGQDFPRKMRIIFSEQDQDWWTEQQLAHLREPELSWFTSKKEGGHCRVELYSFCPKLYEPTKTLTGVPTEFRIIGSQMEWVDWLLTNTAHESVHLYQDSHGQSHWAYWYIEGQATFFELAMGQLLFKSDVVRDEMIIVRPARQDTLRLNPVSQESVTEFLTACEQTRDSSCEAFKYGGGSMFHEKLVLDYGLEAYWNWQSYLNENMPKGNPVEFSQAEITKLQTTFSDSFTEIFGISQTEFEQDVVPAYFFEQLG